MQTGVGPEVVVAKQFMKSSMDLELDRTIMGARYQGRIATQTYSVVYLSATDLVVIDGLQDWK
jgi:hypothetical protein